jgi:hypothetical protein
MEKVFYQVLLVETVETLDLSEIRVKVIREVELNFFFIHFEVFRESF